MTQDIAAFLQNPSSLQLAMFCFGLAFLLVLCDVRNIYRGMKPSFQLDAALATLVGLAQLYLAITS